MPKQTVCWKGSRTEGHIVVDAESPRAAAEYVVDELTWMQLTLKVEVWPGEYDGHPSFAHPDYVIDNG